LSEKDVRVATTRGNAAVPTVEQIKHVSETMPNQNDIKKRNRRLIAFTLLTGARDSATASMKLKHVVLDRIYLGKRRLKLPASHR